MQKEIIDEKRLNEIQKIATTMKVQIPKRFETKSSVREFIQSREFISAIKLNMSVQLYQSINCSNKILDLVQQKQNKIMKMLD